MGRWTARINEEWVGNLVVAGRAPQDRLLLTVGLMNSALPEAEVQGWEVRMEGLMLPDPGDCHVLAAALTAGAETILTMNLRDFPTCWRGACAHNRPRCALRLSSAGTGIGHRSGLSQTRWVFTPPASDRPVNAAGDVVRSACSPPGMVASGHLRMPAASHPSAACAGCRRSRRQDNAEGGAGLANPPPEAGGKVM